MDAHRVAFNTWQEKTEWVQKDKRFDVLLPWGKHRADVMKEYIDLLESRIADLAVQLANAESKCRELAAENVGLKELIEQHANSVAVCPNCSHEEPSETDDIVTLYRSMETPATDAFLAEVRASEAKHVYDSILDNPAVTDMESLVDWLEQHAKDSASFAAQLRQGAAL